MKKRDLYYERIPTKLLKEDIRYLGNILGEVIKEQEGIKFFNLVENVRKLSKANKTSLKNNKSLKKIVKSIENINPKDTFRLTRAFTHFMNFINLAEAIDTSRNLDAYENSQKKSLKHNIFIEEIFENLFKNNKIPNNKIYNLAKNLDIGIVLTAHPTEVKRRTLIQKYHRIIEILEQRDLLKSYPSKLKKLHKQLFDEFTIIWNTDDLKRTRPSPFDEARWGLAIIEDSLWDTIPKVYRRLNSIFLKNMKKGLPKNFNPIQFGSWMGGDRDGNPNVTSNVTKEVILLSRWEAAKLYEKTLTKIIRSYSMKKCSKKIINKVGKSFEPYRVFLRPLRDKMRMTHRSIEQHLVNKRPLNRKILLSSTEEILKPLRTVRESLEENQNENIASGELLDLMRRAKCFGINLARLDIRQESSRHSQLIAEFVKKKFKKNYNKFTEEEKINFLKSKIVNKKNIINKFKFTNRENNEVWSTFKTLADEPSECLGAYVISMTTSASDILSVLFLQKEANIRNKLRVVPLFETLDDLINAKSIMQSLFSKIWYKNLINNKQEVMIGYSDSSKDAGKICASWHQYKAQEDIVKLAKIFSIEVTFFHGRGGSPGRGGGPIQATLRSQPPYSVNGKIRITDQGEVIQQKYGYEPIAEYNLCSYISAVTEATLVPPPVPKDNWRSLIEKMSDISKSSYRKNINQSADFIKYFKTVTPSAALGKLSIDMEKNWPFFNSMLDILDMVITKADPEISKIYEEYLADKNLKRVGKKLRFQFDTVKRLNKKISSKEMILSRKQFRTLIVVRSVYSEVLNIIQPIVIHKIKKNKNITDKKYLNDALLTSIAGISAAMKNTG